MAKQVSLKASHRAGVGRQQARKTRSSALIPGVVYGAHIKPTPIQVEEREIERIFKHATSQNMLVELTLDEGGKSSNRLTFIQEIQHHPTNDKILHLDFHEIRADEKLHAHVAIVAVGEPEGVRTGGGVLEQVLRELDIECLPKDLPERIEVDVSALQIGGNIHVNQLKIPAGVTVLSHADVSVFTVLAPTKEEEVVASTELKEPEVIKQKKAEEGAEGETKAPAAAGKPAAEAKASADKGAAKPAAKAEKK